MCVALEKSPALYNPPSPDWEVYQDWTYEGTAIQKMLLNRQTSELMIIGVTENFIIYAVMKVEL